MGKTNFDEKKLNVIDVQLKSKHTSGPQAARWEKDGYWHITEEYHPTEEDRQLYSASYPPGDKGPFYRWTKESFDTEEAALAAIAKAKEKV